MHNSKLESEEVNGLFDVLLRLKNREECYMFFEDLCTISEIQSLAQRYAIAKLLDAGKTYNEIANETGVSTATISRINKCLQYGADGYRLLLERENNSTSK